MDKQKLIAVRRTLVVLALAMMGVGQLAAGLPGQDEAGLRIQLGEAVQTGQAAEPAEPPSIAEQAQQVEPAAEGQAEAEPTPVIPQPEPHLPADVTATTRALPSGANVAIIRIEDMIYDFTRESLKRRVDRALAEGASLIVIELHTPGGTVPAGMAISKDIKTLPVPTVAWINNNAYSAGILIASAADQIVMSPASATGDCAPIVPGQELSPTERAKALSPILEEFRDNAATNGYDYTLFHAMCVLGVEVYLIEHPETGEQRLVNQAELAVLVKGMTVDRARGNAGSGGWFGFGGGRGGAEPEVEVGAPAVDTAAEAERGEWRLVRQVHDGTTLLTLNQARAKEVGLSTATIGSEAELAKFLGANNVIRVEQTWSEDLAGYLVHPVVRGVLVLALLLGAYIEFQSPGVGIAGGVALLALVTLLGAPFLVGLAEVWHVIVFIIGFALLIIELAFVPGFGLLGIIGLIMMFVGLVLSVVPGGGSGSGVGPIRLPPAQMWNLAILHSLYLLAGVFASFIGFYFLTKYFGSVPLLNRLVLQNEPALAMAGPGALAGSVEAPYVHASGDEAIGGGRLRVGDRGRVTTGLRPSGRAEFGDGQVVDVVSLGQWIEVGRAVEIVEVRGNRIVVTEDGEGE